MMSKLLVRGLPRARASLVRAGAELSALLAERLAGVVAEQEFVERIWTALDAAVDALLQDADAARLLGRTRDAIAMHLRAAAAIEATDTLPEVRTDLLVRAAELVIVIDIEALRSSTPHSRST